MKQDVKEGLILITKIFGWSFIPPTILLALFYLIRATGLDINMLGFIFIILNLIGVFLIYVLISEPGKSEGGEK